MYATVWSSTCTARRRTPRASDTPLGTAHDGATPSCSSRRSQWSEVAWCSWMTKRGTPDYCAAPVTVALVTDTTHYLPRQLVKAKRLHEVSLYVKFQGKQLRESEMLGDFDAF